MCEPRPIGYCKPDGPHIKKGRPVRGDPLFIVGGVVPFDKLARESVKR